MMSWKLSLLFFSAVTLHSCLSDTAEPEDQDESCITKILTVYNQKDGGPYLYKSYNKRPSIPLKDEEDSKAYIIKETECLKSENSDLSQCDYKPDGDMKACDCDFEDPEDMVCVSIPSMPSVISVPSVSSVPKEKRSKRGLGKWKKWWKKHIKDGLSVAVIASNLSG